MATTKVVSGALDALPHNLKQVTAALPLPLPATPKKAIDPFPNHFKPTAEACYEIQRLLVQKHGSMEAPPTVPAPSRTVTGCGEVPDVLDALLRTRLSAATTNENAAKAMAGLYAAYGSVRPGDNEPVNWEKVRQSDLASITEAIKRGGLQNEKGRDIKLMLDTVYEENVDRLVVLKKEMGTGEKSVDFVSGKEMSEDERNAEIARLEENMLSLDHILRMDTDRATKELTKFRGIAVKTAACVLLFCFQRPHFAVDTHVWRLCKWLGWVPQNATRDQTYNHCESRVPDELKYSLHQLFIKHGKTCHKCKASTVAGTKHWKDNVCILEDLVTRVKKVDVAGKGDVKVKEVKGRAKNSNGGGKGGAKVKVVREKMFKVAKPKGKMGGKKGKKVEESGSEFTDVEMKNDFEV